MFKYAVVAEERARRLAVIDPAGPCLDDPDGCLLAPALTVPLTERPHNLAAAGSVVYATHPSAGSMSRVDLATGEVLTTKVGTEPHDVKYASGVLYVADEAGRALLVVDVGTLSVIETIELPARPHDLVVSADSVWVTLIGRGELARVRETAVEIFTTGGSPHDLVVDPAGSIWFSNWNSHELRVFDPVTATTTDGPAGVSEPHHFAVGPEGTVWVSDNGGAAVVGFSTTETVTVEVGPVPHHIGFVDETLVVAVSGSGEAVFIADGKLVAHTPLSVGLHGVAAVELTEELDDESR